MPSNPSFHTTRWTLVQQSRGDDTASRQALSDLCAAYYAPVVTFIMRSGFDETRARDLAHDFFAMLLSEPQQLQPRRERGRFRSYLLGAVKHFVWDTLDRERAQKRGGSIEVLHLTETNSSAPEDVSLAPDRAFDRQWALTLVERVVKQLANEFEASGTAHHFTSLKPWLMGDESDATQAETAQQLGMNEGALKVAIHRLRKRFRELIKAEVAHTVGNEVEAREELAHLLAAM